MKHISLEKLCNKSRLAISLILLLLLALCVSACGSTGSNESGDQVASTEDSAANVQTETTVDQKADAGQDEEITGAMQEDEVMVLSIGGESVSVAWEDNESVEALRDLVTSEPLIIQMSMYGGFEQVGAIGTNLPRNDEQTKTEAGDIVLYSGNQIVIFYGSNSWAYTRLGKVTDKTVAELKELLGNGDVEITIK